MKGQFVVFLRLCVSLIFILNLAGLNVAGLNLAVADQSISEVPTVKIGAKKFTESYILAEIAAGLLEARGVSVRRQFGLGGTFIAFRALQEGEIDLYPEYTGTLIETILKKTDIQGVPAINNSLAAMNLEVLLPLGFNNTYAVAVRPDFAKKKNISKISDLTGSDYTIGLPFEFQERADGWWPMQRIYDLQTLKTVSMELSLLHQSVEQGKINIAIVYSTDPKIISNNLVLLQDNKHFFPRYEAAFLVQRALHPKVKEILLELSGRFTERKMTELNAAAEQPGTSFAQVARQFLLDEGLIKGKSLEKTWIDWSALWNRTTQHLYLTFSAIFMAIIVAVPLGILLLRIPLIATPVMTIAGLLQTIPSIALLAFMIPLFGIGVLPAIMGLFLYSILPILRNTYVALYNIDPNLLESARGIGLYRWEILFLVRLPIAMPVILAGIRTATVINIGTATLAAFIGAGGLGEPIVTGLALNDVGLILEGAVPAAVLAILVEVIFERIEKNLHV